MQPKVSILVPHFQTPDLTCLCLRLLRKHTRRRDYEVIVVDNGSQDGSGGLLERISWVRVVRRDAVGDGRPARSHGLALNLGAALAEAPLLLTIHTDTMVLRGDWLDFLLAELDAGGPRCGLVGSWKMEAPSALQVAGKWLEESCRRLAGKSAPTTRRYARSHCALYRRDALAAWPRLFEPTDGSASGEELHYAIEESGFDCRFVEPRLLGRYVRHLNHATMALNAHFGRDDRNMPRTRSRALARIAGFFQAIGADAILADASLDR